MASSSGCSSSVRSTTEAPGDSDSGSDISVEDGKEVPEEQKRVSQIEGAYCIRSREEEKSTLEHSFSCKTMYV